MKLLSRVIDKKGFGTIKLIAEEAEDMWHAYNLIGIGDYLRSSTIRRVVNESSVGLTSTSRVHTTLTINVKSIDFDTQASVLRVKGTNFEENQFVKMGAYHTIDLELNRKFEITKNEWDSVALERIDEACDPSQNADLAAIVMQEGLSHVCLIQSSMTLVKAKIDMAIPRKRKGMCGNHDKALEKFFERNIQALLTHINFDIVKAIIVASPGFIKDQFYEYMNAYAIKNIQTCKVLIDNKSKFLLVHSASGFKHSLKEIFEDQNLAPRLTDTKALGEVKALEAFYQMLKNEPARAFYGFKHVLKANEAEAIDMLLISDSLFRSKELSERKKYVSIVDRVKENNGQVKIFSSLHVSGEQLLQLTGIAAILRFPMPDIEDESFSDSDDDDSVSGDPVKANGHMYSGANDDTVQPKQPENIQPKPAPPEPVAANITNGSSQNLATNSNTSTASNKNNNNNKPKNPKGATGNSSAANTKKFKNKENMYQDDYDDADYYDDDYDY